VSGSDALIQDYYSHQCSNPVHLTVDTGLSGGRLGVAAYVARTLTLGGRPEPLATQFQEVACEVQTVAVEKIGSAPPLGLLHSSCSAAVLLAWRAVTQATIVLVFGCLSQVPKLGTRHRDRDAPNRHPWLRAGHATMLRLLTSLSMSVASGFNVKLCMRHL